MSEFLPGVGPVFSHHTEVNMHPVAEPSVPAKPTPPLTPEQIRAVDEAMARDQEAHTVANLLGLWTGSMLLRDLAEEHFSPPADEDEQKRKAKPKLPE
jgi:hypothetical protein